METLSDNILDVTKLAPSQKHATIFGHFNRLGDGEFFIIHNDHDPKPLYFQLMNMHGNIFTWEYLEAGPEWWKIRITKQNLNKADAATGNILDVTKLEPRLKHATIFEWFDKLAEGKSFEIHNDHDPRPLYYQLQNLRGDTFTWEYLEAGPEWWKIKISKLDTNHDKVENTSNNAEEKVLDVTVLDPRIKHETIFGEFNKLKPGNSLVILNDHNPRPLYFHLLNMHGEIFNWEYLEEGPEWWKVRISLRKKKEESTAEKVEGDGHILDVTKLEPKRKHPTIFEHFDNLKEGEYFVIHNDHDPKPLYYQMLGERGNVFSWEYLEQGPKWWKVKIRKRKAGEEDATLGEIAARDLRKAQVFKKYGLDFYCKGKKTVKELCAEKGLDVTKVEQELQQVDKEQSHSSMRYNDWSLDFLADFIVNTHHSFTKKNLPDIQTYAAKVFEVHGASHPELKKVHELVEFISNNLSINMANEEQELFPKIKQLVKDKTAPQTLRESLKAEITATENEHKVLSRYLQDLHQETKAYSVPQDACASYTLLYNLLKALEEDLFLHLHLENNILFPKALKL